MDKKKIRQKKRLSREDLIERATLRIRTHGDYWHNVVQFLNSIGRTQRGRLTPGQQDWLIKIEKQLKS